MVMKASFVVLSGISLEGKARNGRVSVALSIPERYKPFMCSLNHMALVLLIPNSNGVNLKLCSLLPPASALSSEAIEHCSGEIQLSRVANDTEDTEEGWHLTPSAMSSSGKILVEAGRGVCIWRVD